MLNVSEITPEVIRVHFKYCFKLFAGTGRELSLKDIARIGGFEYRTVESWSQGKTYPDLCNFMKIAMIFGSEFFNKFLEIAGFDSVRETDGEAAKLHEIICDVAEVNLESVKALSDGKIDHNEKREIDNQLSKLFSKYSGYSKYKN